MARPEKKAHPVVELTWPSRADFLYGVLMTDGLASFAYCPAPGRGLPPAARVGALLSVVIGFEGADERFHAHARVIERKPRGERCRLRLEFLREEAERQELILAFARGESVAYRKRRSPRAACSFAVQIELADGRTFGGTATTISARGLHVSVEDPPEEGTAVHLSFALPESRKKLRLAARVTSAIRGGPQAGFGVAFRFRTAKEKATVAEEVALVRARHRS